jgi:hypothetical protein
VAIAIRQLDPGTVIQAGSETWTLRHSVLEGHRFAVRSVPADDELRSWGQPVGRTLTALAPGDYLCNRSMLEALKVRGLPLTLPAEPNFEDRIVAFTLDEAAFKPGTPVPLVANPRTFQGYVRPGGRGVGTRNCVVILGTTSRTASAARQLAARLQPLARVHPGIDGIVAIAHTEGGGPDEPNNTIEILRAMAGFIVHPNVGAILALDHGTEPVNNARLQAFMRAHGYALDAVPHAFLSLDGALAAGLAEGERLVRSWLGAVNAAARTPAPVSALKVALQCGGSDAFSGVSGNPLAGAIVHEVIRHGGAGNLCETDELVGGESSIMGNMRDLATARALLDKIEAFKERLSWHGITATSFAGCTTSSSSRSARCTRRTRARASRRSSTMPSRCGRPASISCKARAMTSRVSPGRSAPAAICSSSSPEMARSRIFPSSPPSSSPPPHAGISCCSMRWTSTPDATSTASRWRRSRPRPSTC